MMRLLTLVPALILLISCSKNDDIGPEVTEGMRINMVGISSLALATDPTSSDGRFTNNSSGGLLLRITHEGEITKMEYVDQNGNPLPKSDLLRDLSGWENYDEIFVEEIYDLHPDYYLLVGASNHCRQSIQDQQTVCYDYVGSIPL